MNILLIFPPITLYKFDVSTPTKSSLIGLGYIAAVLRMSDHTVKVLDCLVSSGYSYPVDENFTRFGLSDTQILERIKSFNPDVVGISCMFTSYFKDAHTIAKIVKSYNKNILVIFGGAHATTFPDIVMKDNNVDLVVIGEGENTICEVLERYQEGKDFNGVKGIVYRFEGKIKKEEPREYIRNLDDIPFPAWDLLEQDSAIIQQENKKNKFLMRKHLGQILTSRGCPNECYFCSVKLIWGRRWIARSAKNIVDEIEFLKNKYNYKEFHFVDDNSSVSKQRTHEICDELLKRRLDIKLATPTGIAIGTLDKEILVKMKRAGFYRLCFGLESGDPKTQKIIKKKIDLNKAKETIAIANKLGFWTSGTFIIGFPHETMNEIKKTILFTKSSNLDFAIIYLLTPQPSTEVYDILKENGLIDLDKYIDPFSEEWFKISITYNNGFKTQFFSNSQLQQILSSYYREFIIYKIFSLKTYINLIKKIRSLEDLCYALSLSVIPIKMLLRIVTGKKLSNISLIKKNKELQHIQAE
ncbi:MAG: hypothetical protein A2166_02685 [Omnitrophica WOR_2 bacterium RBG_13_41_10]|nr:MAG: hypothetical protein A2166_02685 [Omnitrophica WOR_2 bacterium RBG_13_41_10]